tara:strand:- start:86 stop:406 length:321 start_codon:yes stop_codon:yes gene_type:complete
MRKLLVAVALLIFFKSSANAYTALNAIDCGQVISKHESASAKLQIRYYVTGYISGFNRASSSSIGEDLTVNEYVSLYWAAVKFYKENPLKDLEDASFDVLSQLRNK